MLGVLVWLLGIALLGACGFCLWEYAGSGPSVTDQGAHLHPDTIAEVEAITGEPFYDNNWSDPMLGTPAGNSALAGAKYQVIATVCASRQQRGLPTYI